MKLDRRNDPKTAEHVVTITLTREELERAGGEMTQADKETVYLMSQSPLLTTQICALFSIGEQAILHGCRVKRQRQRVSVGCIMLADWLESSHLLRQS